jgi:general secretion pathway protein B
MSYILDALQKSEQERKQQALPDMHAEPLPLAPAKHHWWPWIVAISLLLLGTNMTALWYWLTPSAEKVQSSGNAPQSKKIMKVEQQSLISPNVALATAPEAPRTDDIKPPVSAEESTQRVTPADFTDLERLRAITPVSVTALPVDIQQQIPALTFSSHLYSDDFRMVNINGRMMREGDLIDPELQLVEITEDGVILSFREYHVQMSVLQNWSFE